MNEKVGTVLQLAGFVCLVAAAWALSATLALFVAGVLLVVVGHAMDGTKMRPPAWWRRRRDRRLRRVA